MSFCGNCNHPTKEQDGVVYIIIDDEFGVNTTPCFYCSEEQKEK